MLLRLAAPQPKPAVVWAWAQAETAFLVSHLEKCAFCMQPWEGRAAPHSHSQLLSGSWAEHCQ